VDSTGLIVIASGPAGVSAAEAFRELNPDDPVRILTDDPNLPYVRPSLSKEFLRGDADIADTELHPAQWFDDKALELIPTGDVNAIDIAGPLRGRGRTALPLPLTRLGMRSQTFPRSGFRR
jgi:3-phenylpropionate/trans-cinnamate dioxygenase ferredoxin reductase subunit